MWPFVLVAIITMHAVAPFSNKHGHSERIDRVWSSSDSVVFSGILHDVIM